MTRPVHHVQYASQPDLQIWCDDSWTTPRYGGSEQVGEPYETADDRLYAFTWEKVTCPRCANKLTPIEIERHVEAKARRDYVARYGTLPRSIRDADQKQRDRMRAFIERHGDPIADCMSVR